MIITNVLDILGKILVLTKERGLTNKQVLEDLGYDKSFFSDWKAGRIKSPPLEKVFEIAEYFDVSIDYLLGVSDNPVRNNKKVNNPYTVDVSGISEAERLHIEKTVELLRAKNNSEVSVELVPRLN